MIDKIRDFFKHNLIFKLISLAVAFFIWLLVVNISNPEVTETVTAKLKVLYADEFEEAGKTYSIDTENVRISYKVRSDYRRQISPESFDVYVDLRDYSITGAVPIYVEPSSRISDMISDITISPMVAHVDTEDMVETSFAAEAKLVGTPAAGKVAGPVTLSSNEITLYGPSSDISNISRVEFDVNIEAAEAEVSGTAVPVFYDAEGNIIELSTDVLIRNEITYTAQIYSTKEVYVSALVTGTPAVGYILNSINITPDSMEVYGTDEALSGITSITIPEHMIDISEATRNVTVSLNVSELLPEGVTVAGGGDVTVVAVITQDRRTESSTTAPDVEAEPSAEVSDAEIHSSAETDSEGTASGQTKEGHAQEASDAADAASDTDAADIEEINDAAGNENVSETHNIIRSHETDPA